jgi:hypothetical protein
VKESVSADELLERAKRARDLGGPPIPWKPIGTSSIQCADGQEMIFQTYRDGRAMGGVNDWSRERICEAVTLLPELIAEIERLRGYHL